MKEFTTKIGLMFMLTLTIGFFGGNIYAQGIEFFHGSVADAKAKAKTEGKLVFVDAYASWCGPCRWMAANVFTDKSVGDYFNKNFINVKLDCEKGEGPRFAQTYKIRAYPTLIFLDAEGNIVKNTKGAKKAVEFIELGKSANKL